MSDHNQPNSSAGRIASPPSANSGKWPAHSNAAPGLTHSRLAQREVIARRLETAVHGVNPDHFENGVESTLSITALLLIDEAGADAVGAIEQWMFQPGMSAEIAAEVIRWLPHSPSVESREARRWVMIDALNHSSPTVRDAAIVALSALDDPDTLPSLRAAQEREPIASLRRDLQQVVDQIQGAEGR